MTEIFDLGTEVFYPSNGSIIIIAILVVFVIMSYKKRSLIPKSYHKPGCIIFVCIFCFVLFGIFSEYRLYVKNMELFESGKFQKLTGKVENILSFSGKPSQEVSVNGVTLYAKKGVSHSFGKDFRDVFYIGMTVEIYYVRKSNGIVQINVANENN